MHLGGGPDFSGYGPVSPGSALFTLNGFSQSLSADSAGLAIYPHAGAAVQSSYASDAGRAGHLVVIQMGDSSTIPDSFGVPFSGDP